MIVSNRVDNNGPFGKTYILEAQLGGVTYTASFVWPKEYDSLNKADAMGIIEHYLWRNLMGAIEAKLRSTLEQAKDSHVRH